MSSEGWPCLGNACSAGLVTAFLLPRTTCTSILLGLVAKPAFPRVNFFLERGVCVSSSHGKAVFRSQNEKVACVADAPPVSTPRHVEGPRHPAEPSL